MAKLHLKLVAPSTEKRTVTPTRRPNAELRTREHLTEIEKLSVQMTVDQRGAVTLFESFGFKAEALLRDHVRDVDGKTHDIVVLGHNVAQVQADGGLRPAESDSLR